MFKVNELLFGRVSWYYQEVAGDPSPTDMGRTRFTPMDLATRWIDRLANWEKGKRVAVLAGGDSEFEHHLADRGVEAVPLSTISGGYVYGGYLLTEAETAWKLIDRGSLDSLYRSIFPFTKVLLAVQLPFAGNRGFNRIHEVFEAEKTWLAMPQDAFRAESGRIPRELAIESPAVLARMLCCRLRVGTEPSFAHCTTDRFVFDPDVMTTPMGRLVDSQAAARRLSGPGGEIADRRGMLLIALSRTARL
jgi:hypothetical protein